MHYDNNLMNDSIFEYLFKGASKNKYAKKTH